MHSLQTRIKSKLRIIENLDIPPDKVVGQGREDEEVKGAAELKL